MQSLGPGRTLHVRREHLHGREASAVVVQHAVVLRPPLRFAHPRREIWEQRFNNRDLNAVKGYFEL